METIVKPMDWSDLTPQARARVEKFRTAAGEAVVLDHDQFVRQAFTGGVLTPVTDADLQEYPEPYPTRESRRPILAWTRQLPLGGEPIELIERIEAYDRWLESSPDVPKLLLTFEGSPTLLIDEAMTRWCRDTIAGLEIVHCGAAGHHAPEDRPAEIAAAIARWSSTQLSPAGVPRNLPGFAQP